MNDLQHITLQLDAHPVSLSVPREQEPIYREAAMAVNKVYQKYAAKYKNLPVETIWVYTALELAVNFRTDVRDKDLQPVLEKIKELNNLINNTLNLQDK